jgi:hypothetical protein
MYVYSHICQYIDLCMKVFMYTSPPSDEVDLPTYGYSLLFIYKDMYFYIYMFVSMKVFIYIYI